MELANHSMDVSAQRDRTLVVDLHRGTRREFAGLIPEAARAFHGDQLQDDLALVLLRISRRPDEPPSNTASASTAH